MHKDHKVKHYIQHNKIKSLNQMMFLQVQLQR